MNVQCELKACHAERPVHEMRVRRQRMKNGRLIIRYRCKAHDPHATLFISKIEKARCARCKVVKLRAELERYENNAHLKCRDESTCAKSSSSTTSI